MATVTCEECGQVVRPIVDDEEIFRCEQCGCPLNTEILIKIKSNGKRRKSDSQKDYEISVKPKSKRGKKSFENNHHEVRSVEKLLENYKKKKPPSSRDLFSMRDTRKFLNLGRKQGDDKLTDEIKQLFPNRSIVTEINQIIKMGNLPDRSIEIDGVIFSTPVRERIGLEVFCHYSTEELGFWFLDDFITRFKINRSNINKILANKLPISQTVCRGLERDIDQYEIGRRFLSRCCQIYLKDDYLSIPLDPRLISKINEELQQKLTLTSVDSPYVNRLHFFEEKEGIANLVETRKGLILYHIPIAYFFAQECYSRRVTTKIGTWRTVCKEILDLIENDCEWCGVDFQEMNKWWENWLQSKDKPETSVTKLTKK